MSFYHLYPAVDENYSFPPEVRKALADSREFSEAYLNKQYADENFSIKPTNGERPAADSEYQLHRRLSEAYITMEEKKYGNIPYTLIVVHAGGSYLPGLTRKYMDLTDEVIERRVVLEHAITVARDNSGATLINNASGLNHITGHPHGEGAKTLMRGAQVVNGVVVNEFPTDAWTGHEAVAALPNGKFKGYSTRRGNTAADIVADGCTHTIASFGPILIEDGALRDLSDSFWNTAKSELSSLNGLGQRPNGDVILINTPGITNQSGAYITDQANILLAEGCEFGFNLDRGGSAQCWAGATPVIASQDVDNLRILNDYLYFKAPVISPVTPHRIPIKLAAGYTMQSATYPPEFWITPDNMVHFSGQIKATDGSLFLNSIYTLFEVPAIALAKTNCNGICQGVETGKSVLRRVLFNATDRGFKLLGDATAQSVYLDISGISWQL